MTIAPLWERNLHMAVNPKSLLVSKDAIYVTERTNYLSKFDLVSGQTIWSSKIPGSWGWSSISGNNLYYMSQANGLFTFDCDSGKELAHHELRFQYYGYVIANENLIVTGGWRGYTDLCAYDQKTFKKQWSRPVKSRNLQEFSVPCFVGEKFLLSVNHSLKKIEIIDITRGIVVNEIDLPDGLKCPDLGCSFSMVDEKATFISEQGYLYTLNSNLSSIQCEKLNVRNIMTKRPYFSGDEIILRNTPDTLSLYDRSKRKTIWEISIEDNDWDDVAAANLQGGLFIVASSYGVGKFVNQSGTSSPAFKTQKRISTPLHYLNGILVYGTKGAIKAARHL